VLAIGAVVAVGAPAVAKSSSATTLATLKVTHTQVSVKPKGKTAFAVAKDGQVLRQGDTIKTDAAGRAEIDYTDGSLTRLSGSTVYTLSVLTNDRGGRQTQGTLSVGETWNRAAKVSETGSFEVKAGGTTAAVEGTAFVVSCTPQGTGQVSCSVTAVIDNVKVNSDDWDVTSVTSAP
jgi:ferric-dicitrate binding protein FerR (iron transport regulator)